MSGSFSFFRVRQSCSGGFFRHFSGCPVYDAEKHGKEHMEIKQSIEILKPLANGTDPFTGEVFSAESPYNHPDVIRALFACIQSVERPPRKTARTPEERQTDNLARGLPKNAGMPWTEEMRGGLAEKFKSGKTPSELAGCFERTTGSIVSELRKQELITEDEARKFWPAFR
jgi:hypothetical protein